MVAYHYLLSFFMLIIGYITISNGQSSGLPPHVQECFENITLYDRSLRIPSSIVTFSALINRIERIQGLNMDMRQLTATLVHRFRVDGVERDPTVQSSIGVIPYTTSGFQNGRHLLLLEKLLSGSAANFPNSSVIAEDKCAMHFMMSTTVDIWERGDENSVCSTLQNFRTYNNRSPRGLRDDREIPQDLPENIELFDREEEDVAKGQAAARQTVEPEKSRCPIEDGVMWTPWGAVSAGTVIATIATGLAQQNVTLQQMGLSTSTGKQFPDAGPVYNVYAAAYSGDLGEVSIRQGPKLGGQVVVGVSGGWNDTALPRHYFLNKYENYEISDAEVRGCLDGLILGLGMADIQNALGSSVTLSQILDMYYSERGIPTKRSYRACQRRDHMGSVASSDMLTTQTRNIIPALQNYVQAVSVTDEAMTGYINNAVSRLLSYVSGLGDAKCLTQNENPTPNDYLAAPAIDLTLVVDPSWAYDDAIGYLSAILREVAPHPATSTLTLYVGSSEEKPMINYTRTILDFYGNFTEERYRYISGSTLDVTKALAYLRSTYAQIREDEKIKNKAGGRSQMVLFTVYNAVGATDEQARLRMQNEFRVFREANPDVRTLFLCSGNKERFRDLVIDPQKDLFQMNAPPGYTGTPDVSDVVKRLKELPARITNPVCGAKWTGSDNNNGGGQQTHFYADPLGIAYYRVMANYFLHSERVTVRFQGTNQGRLIVCFSRNTEQPKSTGDPGQSGTSTNGVTCRNIDGTDSTEFRVEWPCDGIFHAIDCKPLYFSVVAVDSRNRCASTTSGQNQIDGCRYPDMARFTVTANGLGCHSGASLTTALSASLLIIVAILRASLS